MKRYEELLQDFVPFVINMAFSKGQFGDVGMQRDVRDASRVGRARRELPLGRSRRLRDHHALRRVVRPGEGRVSSRPLHLIAHPRVVPAGRDGRGRRRPDHRRRA